MDNLNHLFQYSQNVEYMTRPDSGGLAGMTRVHDKRTNHSNDCITGSYIMIYSVHSKADSLQSPRNKHSWVNQISDTITTCWRALHTRYSYQEKWAPSGLVTQGTPSESKYQAPDADETVLCHHQHEVEDIMNVVLYLQ
jgi:hypothetical protein